MAAIIQNAFYIPETDEYVVSAHVHDFVSHKFKSGKEMFIYGGREYFRRGGDLIDLKEGIDIIDFRLTTDNSFTQEIVHKLLWGTRGKDGRQPLKRLPMASFETDHLQAILDNCPNAGLLYKLTARYWINRRSPLPCPIPSLTSTRSLSG